MSQPKTKSVQDTLGRGTIHPFPARMAPEIALDALGNDGESFRVLDPMVGSGTVLAVAKSKGHRALGFDLDPLAVLLSRVWTKSLDPKAVKEKASEVLSRAQIASEVLVAEHAYPAGADEKTKQFVEFWFDVDARIQLASLSTVIRRVRNSVVRDVLWCGLSRLIITKSAGASLAMDLSHSRPHKAFLKAPVLPFEKFISAVDAVVKNCPEKGRRGNGPETKVAIGDARRMPVRSSSIDLVVTSPPYLNAIDYMRCSKFSLVWMGFSVGELGTIRRDSIGSDAALQHCAQDEVVHKVIQELHLSPQLSPPDQRLLERYVWDMALAVSEVARVLRPAAKAVYVVGDSTVRGTFVRNSRVVSAVARRHGLNLESEVSRVLPANRRYMPPPTHHENAMDSRMREEVVLTFQKAL